jgi:hypothetical protein
VEPAFPSVPGQQLVGPLHVGESGQLRERPGPGRGPAKAEAAAARVSGLPAGAGGDDAEAGRSHQPAGDRGGFGVPGGADPGAAGGAARRRWRGTAARRLLVDGPDLPAAQGQRRVGLLRAARGPAGLRRQPRRDRRRMRAGRPGRADAVDLEPAAVVHRRQDRRAARQRAEPGELLSRGRARDTAGGVVDRPLPAGQRPSAGEPGYRPGVRDEPDQHDHARPGLGLDGDLPGLGRLGRVLRQRGPAAGGLRRVRATGAVAGDQPVRPCRICGPPGPVVRRL